METLGNETDRFLAGVLNVNGHPRRRQIYIKPSWRGRVPKDALLKALNETGSIVGAAVRMNVSTQAVYRWVQKYGIESRKVWR